MIFLLSTGYYIIRSLRGLSVRTLFVDLFSQLIILLFLMDTETSLLVTVPSAMGVAIQLWKCQRATGDYLCAFMHVHACVHSLKGWEEMRSAQLIF